MKKNNLNKKPKEEAATNPSQARKSLIIGVVMVGAVIVLTLLVLLGPKMAGKAWFVPGTISAGIVNPGAITPNTEFPVTVKADIGSAKTVAIGFELVYLDVFSCEGILTSLGGASADGVTSSLGWNAAKGAVLEEAACDDTTHKATFRYATLNTNEDSAKTGEFEIAKILFEGVPAGTYNLDFTSFNIIDLATNQPIVLTVQDPVITVAAPTYTCTGTPYTHAQLCAGDDQGLTANTPLSLVGGCMAGKCEYTCETGYRINMEGNACEAVSFVVNALFTVAGTRINLTEIAPAGGQVFATLITALENFNATELTAYTTLKDVTGKVLVLKREIVPGMNAGGEYIVAASYPVDNVVKEKRVVVYDKLPHQGWTVHGNLSITYP